MAYQRARELFSAGHLWRQSIVRRSLEQLASRPSKRGAQDNELAHQLLLAGRLPGVAFGLRKKHQLKFSQPHDLECNTSDAN